MAAWACERLLGSEDAAAGPFSVMEASVAMQFTRPYLPRDGAAVVAAKEAAGGATADDSVRTKRVAFKQKFTGIHVNAATNQALVNKVCTRHGGSESVQSHVAAKRLPQQQDFLTRTG